MNRRRGKNTVRQKATADLRCIQCPCVDMTLNTPASRNEGEPFSLRRTQESSVKAAQCSRPTANSFEKCDDSATVQD